MLINLVEFDPQLKEAADGVDSALIQIEEATRALNRYLQNAELDPERLNEVETRIQAIHNTSRKYRIKPEQLPELLTVDLLRMTELESFANDGALAKLESETLSAYQASAKQLSAKRQVSANTLSKKISLEMQRLSLSGGRFDARPRSTPSWSA